jgi:hypothetical protein
VYTVSYLRRILREQTRAGKKKREGSEIFWVLYHQGVNQFPPLSSGGGYSPSSEMTPLSFFIARQLGHIEEDFMKNLLNWKKLQCLITLNEILINFLRNNEKHLTFDLPVIQLGVAYHSHHFSK